MMGFGLVACFRDQSAGQRKGPGVFGFGEQVSFFFFFPFFFPLPYLA